MKVRGIHLKGHQCLGDISLDFRSPEGRVLSEIVITGSNGSGKTLLAELVAMGWGSAVMPGSYPYNLRAEYARVDFEVGSEITSVEVRGGRVEKNALLRGKINRTNRENVVVFYDKSRLERIPFLGQMPKADNSGVAAVYPVLFDIMRTGGARDSVVVIDDIEMGLDEQAVSDFWTLVRKHCLSSGNQLIFTTKGRVLPTAKIYKLEHRDDPIQVAVEAFVLVQASAGASSSPAD